VTTPGSSKGPPGFVVGSVVAITFGAVFVLVNSGGLPGPWPLVVRAAGLLVGALLLAGLVLVAREAPPATLAPVSGFVDRRFWIIVALEAVALFGGLFVVNDVLRRTAVSVAWVALVVGVHFFGLARIWRTPLYHWLGAAMTVLALVGFLIYALGGTAATVGLVAGVGSGAAMFAVSGAALRVALRGRTSVVARQ
jgi:hypothetical protein